MLRKVLEKRRVRPPGTGAGTFRHLEGVLPRTEDCTAPRAWAPCPGEKVRALLCQKVRTTLPPHDRTFLDGPRWRSHSPRPEGWRLRVASRDSTPVAGPSPLVCAAQRHPPGALSGRTNTLPAVTHTEKSPSPGFLDTRLASWGTGLLPGTLPLPWTTGSWGPRPWAPPYPEPKSLPASPSQTLCEARGASQRGGRGDACGLSGTLCSGDSELSVPRDNL